ncbi:GntR family transcriptional regulator [Phreatobacter stygius]|nr:GntR family transcriptional regulator [Phreatobacter stygius]
MTKTTSSVSPLQRDLARGILDLLRGRGAAAGDRLSRVALAEALGVSRTPVNGAVALLEEMGIVAIEGRSVRIVDLDRDASRLASSGDETSIARLLVGISRARRDGTLPDEVSERHLAQHFSAGRTTVAHALRQLAEAGVVTRNRGHGWSFTQGFASAEDRAASYRFRMLLEPAALLEPTFALPPGFEARMRADHARFLDRPWTADDAVAFFETNAAFHAGLAEASGNRFFAPVIAQQNRLRLLSNYAWQRGAERVEVSVREHLAILDALVAGDRQKAAELMRQHLAGAAALTFQMPGSGTSAPDGSDIDHAPPGRRAPKHRAK